MAKQGVHGLLLEIPQLSGNLQIDIGEGPAAVFDLVGGFPFLGDVNNLIKKSARDVHTVLCYMVKRKIPLQVARPPPHPFGFDVSGIRKGEAISDLSLKISRHIEQRCQV